LEKSTYFKLVKIKGKHMALLKSIKHPTGAYATYWKIGSINLQYLAKSGVIQIFGYVDENARRENMQYLDFKLFNVYGEDFESCFSIDSLDSNLANPVKNAYNYIKSLTDREFTNSTDV
jgi:hypothetical protein